MASSSVPKLTLIGAEHSYFSAKARSYLRYKGQQGVFFQEALSTLDMYKHVILPMVGVNFIPVLLVHDESGNVMDAIQDTSLIIDYVEENFPTTPSIHPSGAKQRFVSYLIELWSDEWLKMPAMHYRWSFLDENKRYLVHEWGLASMPHLPADKRDDQVLNSQSKGASFNAMKGTLPLLGITPEIVPEIERSFMQLLLNLETHFRSHKFLLGARPCLGDFALVGPLYAHLYKDPKPSGILRSKSPALCEYLERMNGMRPSYDALIAFDPSKNQLQHSVGGPAQFGRIFCQGDFIPNDEIPQTLLPVVETIFREHIPVLLSTCHELLDFIKGTNQDAVTVLPRSTGYHNFKLGAAQGQRLAYPYDVWMLQRCMDSIQDKDIVFPFIENFINGTALLEIFDLLNSQLRLRLVRYKMYLDPRTPPQAVQSKL